MQSRLCAVAIFLVALGGLAWPAPVRANGPAGSKAKNPAKEEPGEPVRVIIEAAPGLRPAGEAISVRVENLAEFPSVETPVLVRVENAQKLATSDHPVWVQVANAKALKPGTDAVALYLAIGVALVALATLGARTYFGWQNTQQQYYVYLGNLWYKIKEHSFDNTDWLDSEWTSLHVLRAHPRTEYDIYASMCWAFAEDCWATYRKSRPPKFAFWRKWRERFYEQFKATIERTNELHRSWFDLQPHGTHRDGFIKWFDETFLPSIKVETEGVVEGRGVVACETISKDRLIGTLRGEITPRRGEHTLEIAKDTHLEIDKGTHCEIVNGESVKVENCKLCYLNHSSTPNAVVRGLNVVAWAEIPKDDEITLNYNTTEWTIDPEDSATRSGACGYSKLSETEQKNLRPLLHVWIRREEPPVIEASAPTDG